ncbi:SDR family oxidoreductase [Embleya sp. AB8]|uniref:SDR family oxidoreductase n=1 Tax=Embleya sp. AB8 TaxID=3156304 RepID=UPI003C710744
MTHNNNDNNNNDNNNNDNNNDDNDDNNSSSGNNEAHRDLSVTARPLHGRVAVVTGAGSGIGAATARALAAAGADVAVLGRRADRLAALAEECASDVGGGVVLPVPADVCDRAELRRAADRIRARFGPVDLVVASAGVMLGGAFESAETAEWDRMVDVNLNGLLDTGRVFADDLLAAAAAGRPADLVHIGSLGGQRPFPGWSVYCATKAAVAHLSRGLRAEFGPRGVRVKNVEPGVTLTELGDDMQDAASREALGAMRAALTPMSAEDVGAVIAYAVAAPAHVNLAELLLVPTAQG